MEFTKKERHEIYKEAKTHLNKEWFICLSLKEAIRNKISDKELVSIEKSRKINKILDYFPEIKKQKPKNTVGPSTWFFIGERKVRIDIFNKAIEETKPKSNAKSRLRKRVVKRTGISKSRKTISRR